MRILADTNVLLRAFPVGHSDRAVSVEAIERLRQDCHQVAVVPQVLYEHWVVATRPVDQNGFGLSAVEADERTGRIIRVFRFFRDERSVFGFWHSLVLQYGVNGKQVHDARLVAAMQRHGLGVILTFNAAHFSRYKGVKAISPHEAVAGKVAL